MLSYVYTRYVYKHAYIYYVHYTLISLYNQDPDRFLPERWEPGHTDSEQLKRCVMPFGAGLRQCIGQNLATMEMRIILATLLRYFIFELVSDSVNIESEWILVTKPKNVKMKFRSRKD